MRHEGKWMFAVLDDDGLVYAYFDWGIHGTKESLAMHLDSLFRDRYMRLRHEATAVYKQSWELPPFPNRVYGRGLDVLNNRFTRKPDATEGDDHVDQYTLTPADLRPRHHVAHNLHRAGEAGEHEEIKILRQCAIGSLTRELTSILDAQAAIRNQHPDGNPPVEAATELIELEQDAKDITAEIAMLERRATAHFPAYARIEVGQALIDGLGTGHITTPAKAYARLGEDIAERIAVAFATNPAGRAEALAHTLANLRADAMREALNRLVPRDDLSVVDVGALYAKVILAPPQFGTTPVPGA